MSKINKEDIAAALGSGDDAENLLNLIRNEFRETYHRVKNKKSFNSSEYMVLTSSLPYIASLGEKIKLGEMLEDIKNNQEHENMFNRMNAYFNKYTDSKIAKNQSEIIPNMHDFVSSIETVLRETISCSECPEERAEIMNMCKRILTN